MFYRCQFFFLIGNRRQNKKERGIFKHFEKIALQYKQIHTCACVYIYIYFGLFHYCGQGLSA